jgi:hypothetical protein
VGVRLGSWGGVAPRYPPILPSARRRSSDPPRPDPPRSARRSSDPPRSASPRSASPRQPARRAAPIRRSDPRAAPDPPISPAPPPSPSAQPISPSAQPSPAHQPSRPAPAQRAAGSGERAAKRGGQPRGEKDHDPAIPLLYIYIFGASLVHVPSLSVSFILSPSKKYQKFQTTHMCLGGHGSPI